MKNPEAAIQRLSHLASLLGRPCDYASLTELIGKRNWSAEYVRCFDELVGGNMFDGRCSRRVRNRVEELIRESTHRDIIPIGEPIKREMPKYMRPILRRLKKRRPEEYERQVLILLEHHTHESVFAGEEKEH